MSSESNVPFVRSSILNVLQIVPAIDGEPEISDSGFAVKSTALGNGTSDSDAIW